MKNKKLLNRSLLISSLLSLVIAIPAMASTQDEVKALKGEIEELQQGQEQIIKELAEIKNLLKQKARAAPGATAFRPRELEVGESAYIGSANAPVTMFS